MQTVMAMVMKAETGNKAQAAAVKTPTIEESLQLLHTSWIYYF